MKSDNKEQLLLQGLATNNTNAIEAIYKTNFNAIQALILNNNGSYDDAKDVFQEAMVVLYEKSKDEDFVLNCQIKTFLYAVCKRLWLKRLQYEGRLSKNSNLNLAEENLSVEGDLDLAKQKEDEFELMEAALNKIGEPCKSLLKAFYIEKKNMVELVEIFGYTNADNAKNQKYKCLLRLKKLFFVQYNKYKEDE